MTRVQILHRGKKTTPKQQIQIISMALLQALFVAPVSHCSNNYFHITYKHKSTNYCGFILQKSFCN